MNSEKIDIWVQVIGMAAVIASLIFVGLEMQQDQRLVRSELGSQSFENSVALELVAADPAMASAFLIMQERPEDLTPEQEILVNSVLFSAKLLMNRECYLVNRNVFVECEGLVRSMAARYFSNDYAQFWWKNDPLLRQTNGYLPAWVDEEIEKVAPNKE